MVSSAFAPPPPPPQFDAEEKAEPLAFRRRLAPATVAALKHKLGALEAAIAEGKARTGIAAEYHYAIEDLIKNALVEL